MGFVVPEELAEKIARRESKLVNQGTPVVSRTIFRYRKGHSGPAGMAFDYWFYQRNALIA